MAQIFPRSTNSIFRLLIFGAVFAAGTIFATIAVGLAIFQQWAALLATFVATFFFFLARRRWNRRRDSLQAIRNMQRADDQATKTEREAAARVAAILEPLGVPSIEEFVRRRERALALSERKASAQRNAERAGTARAAAEAAGEQFDGLARSLVAPSRGPASLWPRRSSSRSRRSRCSCPART